MPTHVLGVFSGHDAAACLLIDGRVAVMIEEERLTRVKHALPDAARTLWSEFGGHFGYFPWASVGYCLATAGLGLDDLDAIVLPHEETDGSALIDLLPLRDKSKVIVSRDPEGSAHHYRHALSAFLASPFSSAAVLVVDGDGSVSAEGYEAESGYLFHDRAGGWEQVFKNRYPLAALRGGLGWAFDYVSAVLGFVAQVGYLGEPGKTMGLAPLGQASADLAEPWITTDGFELDFDGLHRWLIRSGNLARVDFASRERALIQDARSISADARDLAWKVQNEAERALVHLATELRKATGATALCLAGGVALNSVANGKIARAAGFEQVFVQPAAHDAGQAIGLAYYGHQVLQAKTPAPIEVAPIENAIGGRTYPEESIAALLKASGLSFSAFRDEQAAAASAGGALAAGQVLGWFQGGSEYGPRALGHRSILADPRGPSVKDQLNARVKFREGFRPFAPSVLADRAGEVFELEGESPYMLLVAPVRPAWREQIPAVTHVDGTARIQTVTAAQDPLYHALISSFHEQTQVPLVLNTSFNLRGMPLVETPEHALRCFLLTDMDGLYLGRYRVEPPALGAIQVAIAPGWELFSGRRSARGAGEPAGYFERSADGRRVEITPPHARLVDLCEQLDGKRTLQAAAERAVGKRALDPQTGLSMWRFTQRLLREGALQLRVGSLVL